MSKYTTEVRFICENYAGRNESSGYDDVDEIVNLAAPKIFENFPIFNEEYRAVLEHKILRHYYTREIGFETVGLWKLHLNNKLFEIMPYYNKLYTALENNFNPFTDVDLTRTRDNSVTTSASESEGARNSGTTSGNTSSTINTSGTNSSTSTGQRANTNNGISKYSDTPQGGLTDLRNDRYLSSAQADENSGTESSNATNSGQNAQATTESGTSSGTTSNTSTRNASKNIGTTEEFVEHITGKQGVGSYSKMFKEYADCLINVDVKIINDLADLFMNVW